MVPLNVTAPIKKRFCKFDDGSTSLSPMESGPFVKGFSSAFRSNNSRATLPGLILYERL